MRIENNLENSATCATCATLLGRLRGRRTEKNDDIQGVCAPPPSTEPEVVEESLRHLVVPPVEAQRPASPEAPVHGTATKTPASFRAADLAHGAACTTCEAELAKLRVSYPHQCVCPATSTPWNFRYVSDCATKCKTPCELQATI